MNRINLDLPRKWISILLFILAFVLYGNTLFNKYSLDDQFVITNNEIVKEGISGIPKLFSRPFISKGNFSIDYRPIILTTFALEYQFFGESPTISHFINVLLYAFCLVLIYQLLTEIFEFNKIHKGIPLLIILIYAIHPLHTEVVASLKNRDELLSMIFGILFLLQAHRFLISDTKKTKYALKAILFLLLSITSKLIGIVFLGFLIVYIFYKGLFKFSMPLILFMLGCFAIAGSLIWFNSIIISRYIFYFENSLIFEKNPLIIAATSLKILLHYIQMFFIPQPLRFYYGYNLFPIQHVYDFDIIFSFIIHFIILVYGIYALWKKRLIGVLLICYLGCLVFYANYPYLYIGMFSERAAFVSSLWLSCIVILILYNLLSKIKWIYTYLISLAILLVVVLIFSFKTIQRNLYWKNSLTLMSHDIKYLENSVNAHYIYANNLIGESKQITDTAESRKVKMLGIQQFLETIHLFPTYPLFHYQLAMVYKNELNDLEKTKIHLQNALIVDSLYKEANLELGQIYYNEKNLQQSSRCFYRVYNQGKQDSLIYFYLTQIANTQNNLAAVYSLNLEYLNRYPNLEIPYMNLGVYYSKKLRDDSAVVYFEKAIELGNKNPQLMLQLASYFKNKNDLIKAEKYYTLYKNSSTKK